MHARDIQLAPGISDPMPGVGPLRGAPLLAFALEPGFGSVVLVVLPRWGGRLAVIVLFNLANLSFVTAELGGPERMLAHRPLLIVTAILVQIVTTLTLVGIFARQPAPAEAPAAG